MGIRKRITLVFLLVATPIGCSPDALRKPQDVADPLQLLEDRVETLLRQMTLEEKIGQLTQYSTDWENTGPSVPQQYKDEIKAGRVGSIFNAYTTAFTRELQQFAVENSRLGIPLLFGYDVIHGFKTIFPIPLGETASWDLNLMESSARIAATEASASGLHWTFGPMVDIARDPRWGRIAEGAGEDTFLGSLVATARVRGFQGDVVGSDDSVMACAKHFAAYGAAEGGRDYNTVDVSERTLREVYLPPFKAALDAGVATFMTAFNEIAGVPSTANSWLVNDVLRGEWNFDGFVVSDFTSINELIKHGVAADLADAGELAIESGVDMDMQGAVYRQEMARLIADGRVSEDTIDVAAKRVLKWKFKLGLVDDPFKFSDAQREQQRTMTAANLEQARIVAKKSIVLLKNAGSVLPLAKDVGSIALIGPLGDDQKEPLGSWSAAGNAQHVVTLLQGIRAKVSPTTRILVAKGAELTGDDRSGFAEALARAAEADVIVAALGEAAWMSGEAASRSSLALPGLQLELLKELHKLGKPVVLVLMNGRPLILNWPEENIPAILETWFLGTQTGNAIADVLFGDYNPSGRLPVSFPRAEGQIPLYYNAKNTGRPFSADDKYTSKYLDVPNSPLYPFGFGLSYTTFTYANLRLSKSEISSTEELDILIDVTNAGSREGIETVQLYVTDEVGSVTRPVRELRGFKQVLLQPKETQTVVLHLTGEVLAFYNINMQHVVENGRFKIQVGPHSDQLLSQPLTVR